jgi:hypothetical protein
VASWRGVCACAACEEILLKWNRGRAICSTPHSMGTVIQLCSESVQRWCGLTIAPHGVPCHLYWRLSPPELYIQGILRLGLFMWQDENGIMYAAYQLGRRMDYLRFKKYDERVFSCMQPLCTWAMCAIGIGNHYVGACMWRVGSKIFESWCKRVVGLDRVPLPCLGQRSVSGTSILITSTFVF